MAERNARDRLLRATTVLLSRDGYRGLSIQEVLAQAEATSGSLYHHFPGGKEELAAAAIRHAADRVRAGLAAVLEERGLAEALAWMCDAAAGGCRDSGWVLGCPVGTPAADGVAASEVVALAVSESLTAWIDLLAGALRDVGLPEDEATDLAEWAVTAYQGALLLVKARRSVAPMHAARRRLLADLERAAA